MYAINISVLFVSLCYVANSKRNDELLIQLGRRIREVRESKNIGQRELALLCDVEHSQINRIELGKINTTVSTLFLIAEKLEVNPEELIKFKTK